MIDLNRGFNPPGMFNPFNRHHFLQCSQRAIELGPRLRYTGG
jgi:hypothetical protein